jgi:hypothetical protein
MVVIAKRLLVENEKDDTDERQRSGESCRCVRAAPQRERRGKASGEKRNPEWTFLSAGEFVQQR